jgi:hypothetical protein
MGACWDDLAHPRSCALRIETAFCCDCSRPPLTQSGHRDALSQCPLSGVKRTWSQAAHARRGAKDRDEHRQSAGAITLPSDVGSAIFKTRRAAGYRARIMLWFSGVSKQSVVLNSQAFIDPTEYIPAQVSGGICGLGTAVRHALRTF